MKAQKEYVETSNRWVYNRSRKEVLERHGKIRCSICRYNDNENGSSKWYGEIEYPGRPNKDSKRFPNWKLVSKNRKQWQTKRVRKESYSTVTTNRRWWTGYKIVW